MERKTSNVVLFPKWKQTLEQESLRALEQKEYEKALEKLNQLIAYDEQKYEIVMGKIISLMELNQYDKAQEFCESVLENRDENYYQYFHMYVTILFQTSQYQFLMEQVDSAVTDDSVPIEMKETFQQLHVMSKNMQQEKHIEQSHYFVDELDDAFAAKDYRKQWRLIEKLKFLDIIPPEKFYTYLTDDTTHPVVKTNLFQWLQQSGTKDWLEVHKEDGSISVQSSVFPTLTDHTLKVRVELLLKAQEQKNPSLYHLMAKLLYRYLYVCYPIFPSESDAKQIAKALRILGERYLQNDSEACDPSDESSGRYMKKIELYETLYLSVLDD